MDSALAKSKHSLQFVFAYMCQLVCCSRLLVFCQQLCSVCPTGTVQSLFLSQTHYNILSLLWRQQQALIPVAWTVPTQCSSGFRRLKCCSAFLALDEIGWGSNLTSNLLYWLAEVPTFKLTLFWRKYFQFCCAFGAKSFVLLFCFDSCKTLRYFTRHFCKMNLWNEVYNFISFWRS